MSNPANAFAPGSPAGGASVAAMGGMPPLNLNIASSAKSGDITSSFANDASGFSVNYGSGVLQGGKGSSPLLLLGAALLGFLLWKKKSA